LADSVVWIWSWNSKSRVLSWF